MKKDRNSFFEQSSFYSGASFNNPPMNTPYMTGSYSNQGYYAGPNTGIPMNYNTNMGTNSNYNDNYYNDIESRLSKIERNISRLDARITKLENSNNYYTTDDLESTNNVYML